MADELKQRSSGQSRVEVYWDKRRICADCGRPFLFFAEEQKYWYETLGFSIHTDCGRCVPCRRTRHRREALCAQYAELSHIAQPTDAQLRALLDTGIELLRFGLLGPRATQRLRAALNKLWPRGSDAPERAAYQLALAAAAPPGA